MRKKTLYFQSLVCKTNEQKIKINLQIKVNLPITRSNLFIIEKLGN